MDLKLEVVMLPVSDVDRARDFYRQLGFRMDIDKAIGDDFRVVQLTPPGSACSIIIGTVVTTAQPGTVRGLTLVVDDIEAARSDLAARGAGVGEVYHDKAVIHHAATSGREAGPDPERRSYASFADFSDPDGNEWTLQEITQRAPGR
jgi:catechol 2,3-dioxygenase-like lactoylglutathione lyase family enzyme